MKFGDLTLTEKDVEVEYEPLVEKGQIGPVRSQRRPTTLLWIIQAALLSCSLLMLWQSWRISNAAGNCIKKTSMYSPVLDVFEDEYTEIRFMGTLNGSSPYKGPPNEQVDLAWQHLTGISPFGVDKETLVKIKAPDLEAAIELPEEAGGGYMVEYEAQHHLHCLNMLWQYTWIDYYQNRSVTWSDPPEMVRIHLDHCVDLLRQKLMCDADVGLVTYNWVKDYPRPYPNFNVMHKCRNKFENYVDWAHKHAAPWPHPKPLPMKEGAIVLDKFP